MVFKILYANSFHFCTSAEVGEPGPDYNENQDNDKVTLTLPTNSLTVLPDAQTTESSQQFSTESPSDSKELIEPDEQSGMELSEAQKERARSRGMSLLIEAREKVTDEPKTGKLFGFLQILTASFGAFAHGGNDVRYLE